MVTLIMLGCTSCRGSLTADRPVSCDVKPTATGRWSRESPRSLRTKRDDVVPLTTRGSVHVGNTSHVDEENRSSRGSTRVVRVQLIGADILSACPVKIRTGIGLFICGPSGPQGMVVCRRHRAGSRLAQTPTHRRHPCRRCLMIGRVREQIDLSPFPTLQTSDKPQRPPTLITLRNIGRIGLSDRARARLIIKHLSCSWNCRCA